MIFLFIEDNDAACTDMKVSFRVLSSLLPLFVGVDWKACNSDAFILLRLSKLVLFGRRYISSSANCSLKRVFVGARWGRLVDLGRYVPVCDISLPSFQRPPAIAKEYLSSASYCYLTPHDIISPLTLASSARQSDLKEMYAKRKPRHSAYWITTGRDHVHIFVAFFTHVINHRAITSSAIGLSRDHKTA